MVCSTSASVTSAGKNIYRLLHGSLIFFTVFRAFLETLPGMVLGVAFTVGSSAPSAAGIRTRVTRAGVSSAAPLRFFRLDACFGEIVPLSDWFMAAYTDCCSSGFKKDRSYAATKVISPASNRASSSGESFCPHTRFAGQKNNLYNGKG